MKDERLKAEAAPSAADFASEAGARITYGPDGTWTGTIRGKKNIRRALHMQNGTRRVEIERGLKLDASRPKEMLRDERGRAFPVAEHLAERVAKKRGLRIRTGASLTGGWLPNARDREREERGEA